MIAGRAATVDWPRGACRVALGVLALVAVGAQLEHGIGEPPFSTASFFSFFTVESNLIAAAVLIAAGTASLRGSRRGRERLDLWRGAATLYMATTGAVYAVLLAGDDDGTLLGWVNVVLHYVMPVAMAADWALDLPRSRIAFRRALAWIAFPAAFIAYTLIRGAVVDWYPYPFVDVDARGYPAVLLTSVVIGAAMLGLAWLLTLTTGRRAGARPWR